MKAPKLSFKKKHIVRFGDSNTHGWCADAADCIYDILLSISAIILVIFYK